MGMMPSALAFDWAHYSAALPEMFLAVWALVMLVASVSIPVKRAAHGIAFLSGIGLLCAFFLLWQTGVGNAFPFLANAAGFMYKRDMLVASVQGLIYVLGVLIIPLALYYFDNIKQTKPEFFILLILSILGMQVFVASTNMLSLYIGLEMMSFCLYIMCAFERDNARSSEAGLKYFIMGSLASGVLLYGISMLYGISGTLSFEGVESALSAVQNGEHGSGALALSLVLVLTGILFKVSAAPFHMWTPDVYEGSPLSTTTVLSTLPKIAALTVLIKLVSGPLLPVLPDVQQVIAIAAVLTMGVGAIAAFLQTSIKRLLAYSSISHVGFMLIGVAAGTAEGMAAALFYVTVYSIMTLGVFAVLHLLHVRGHYVENVKDLAGLGASRPVLMVFLLIGMFSLAGVPPFAGFFAKLIVFQVAVENNMLWLTVAGGVFSMVALGYSLKLLKTIYFEKGSTTKVGEHSIMNINLIATTLMGLTLFLGIFPNTLWQWVLYVAGPLF